MERYADTGQFYNWYDHRTGAKLTAWPPAHDPKFHPILSSVDNGWLAVGLKIVAATACRSCRTRARARSMTRWTSASTTGPTSTACSSTTGPTTRRRHRAATTRSSARAGSSTTSGSPAGSCRARSTTGAGAAFPDTVRLRLPGEQADRRHAHVLRRRRLRGRLPYAGMQVTPVLGRLDVRGADARPVRARGALGAAQLGRQPPGRPSARRSTTA